MPDQRRRVGWGASGLIEFETPALFFPDWCSAMAMNHKDEIRRRPRFKVPD